MTILEKIKQLKTKVDNKILVDRFLIINNGYDGYWYEDRISDIDFEDLATPKEILETKCENVEFYTKNGCKMCQLQI